AYVVRLSDQTDVEVCQETDQFEANLELAFPECRDAALNFYRRLRQPAASDKREPITKYLADASARFRSFIDGQLEIFSQSNSDQTDIELAATVLNAPTRGFWGIRGGGQSLATALAESFKQSGGRLRLNSP